MLETVFARENIVHFGAALYLIGFLFREQIVLRAFVIAGDLVYISYFYFAPKCRSGVAFSGAQSSHSSMA